jgi:hypothetical protein
MAEVQELEAPKVEEGREAASACFRPLQDDEEGVEMAEVAKVDLAKAVAGSATKEGRLVGVWVEVGAADSEAAWVEAMVVDVE